MQNLHLFLRFKSRYFVFSPHSQPGLREAPIIQSYDLPSPHLRFFLVHYFKLNLLLLLLITKRLVKTIVTTVS